MIELLLQKWDEYTIQLFLVILGISVPFIISRVITNRKDKKLEKKYLKLLVEDLTGDLDLLKINHNNINSDRLQLIDFIEKLNSIGVIDEQKLKYIIPLVVKYYHFIPLNSTFNDLESTGNMKLISDIRVRQSIFKYYRLNKFLTIMEGAYEKETEGFLKPTILKYFPIRRLPQYDFAYANSDKFKLDTEDLANNVNIENALLIKTDLLNNLRIKYENLIALNEETLKNLNNK